MKRLVSLPPLSHYAPVVQTRPIIKHYQREADAEWTYTPGNEMGSLSPLIECWLVLAGVYYRVEFPPSLDGVNAGEAI